MGSNAQIVFVVDDDKDFRESLLWLLEGAGYSCLGYGSAEEFLRQYQGQEGCLLLDVRMQGMSGLALQQELNRRKLVLPVIMITGHGDVAMAVQAMKNNAADFIEKPFDDEVLLTLIAETLKKGEQEFSEKAQIQQVEACWQALSKRERQVAGLVVEGFSNREIAEKLDISIKTVEIHRSRVMSKMQAKKVTELVALAALLDKTE
jgi:two-component system, LuxR family, response regulator FixJ